jgi:hypothetical protein
MRVPLVAFDYIGNHALCAQVLARHAASRGNRFVFSSCN